MARKIRYDPRLDYYVVLGVAATASAEEIQRVYRQRAKQVHPDLHPEDPEQAKHQFQILNEAYAMLSDETARLIYDQQRRLSLGIRDIPPFVDPLFEEQRTYGYSSQYSYNAEIWRTAWRNILRSPSHRLVFMVILLVFTFNLTAVFFGPQIQTLVNRANTAQAAQDQTPPQSTTQHVIFVLVSDRLTPIAPVTPVCSDHIRITEPINGSEINGDPFDVRGTANDPDLFHYTIEIDSVSSGARWILQLPMLSPVTNDVLLNDMSIGNFPLGEYILRLRVQRSDETYAPPCEVRIRRKR